MKYLQGFYYVLLNNANTSTNILKTTRANLLTCPCGFQYIERTTCTLKGHLGEHISNIKSGFKDHPVSRHYLEVHNRTLQVLQNSCFLLARCLSCLSRYLKRGEWRLRTASVPIQCLLWGNPSGGALFCDVTKHQPAGWGLRLCLFYLPFYIWILVSAIRYFE